MTIGARTAAWSDSGGYTPDGSTAFLLHFDAETTFAIWINNISVVTAKARSIRWGDGDEETISANTNKNATHTYSAGDYVCRVEAGVNCALPGYNSQGITNIIECLEIGEDIGYVTNMFKNATNLRRCCEITNTFLCTSLDSMFFGCTSLENVIAIPSNVTTLESTWRNCTSITTLPDLTSENITTTRWSFYGCTNLACEVPALPPNDALALSTFFSCGKLTGNIKKWPTTVTNSSYCYSGCTGLTGAWTDDVDELMPSHITSYGNTVTGASAALRSLFYSSWGGTRSA